MFSARWIREHGDLFDSGLARRGVEPHADRVLELDARRRAAQSKFQEQQHARNRLSKEIGAARARGEDTAALVAEVSALKDVAQEWERKERKIYAQLVDVLQGLPNLPAGDVPDGADESANVELRRWGKPRKTVGGSRQHFEIGEALGLMDFERAAELSGSRFVVLSGALARLERALGAFMLDMHTNEFGYTEISPPLLVRNNAAYGTGNLPKFREDLFETTDGRWLIPTAEMPLTNLVAGEILEEGALPRRFTAYTPCFRAEAGAAGKDTRGMLRQHQFSKVELVSVTRPEDSEAEHERMTECAEEVLKRLGLAYRVVVLCAGDMASQRARPTTSRSGCRGRGATANLELLQLLGLPSAADGRALPAIRRAADAPRAHPQRLGARGRPHPGRCTGDLSRRAAGTMRDRA